MVVMLFCMHLPSDGLHPELQERYICNAVFATGLVDDATFEEDAWSKRSGSLAS